MQSLLRGGLAASFAGALLASEAAAAPSPAVRVDIRAGPMREALAELVRENRIELLADDALVRRRRVRALKGSFTAEQALSRLLSGTGVGYRQTPDGAFVLLPLSGAPAEATDDGAIAEVLVIGRRTQNADIRRTQNDIQPYIVMGSRELKVAPQDNTDQYLRDRLPANGQTVSPSQYVVSGADPTSAVDLRGIGTQRTLVLVDGRRLPGRPTEAAGLLQGDVNAIPLSAVERIETLTATAGGIHGPTAIGGVVNLVLNRDLRGLELTAATGRSSRGDAGRVRLEARAGFTAAGADVTLAASYAAADPLTVGQRDYARRSLQRQAANNPKAYAYRTLPVNAVVVYSDDGRPLRLDPAFGGATLNNDYSFLPLDFEGDEQARAAALTANSGRLVSEPPPGTAGDDTSLITTPRSFSALFSVRRRISDRLEAFADGVYLSNEGRALTSSSLRLTANADAPGNVFDSDVTFNFPILSLAEERRTTSSVHRLTGGLIAGLPGRWQASVEHTTGRAVLDTQLRRLEPNLNLGDRIRDGLPGSNGEAPAVPLGDFEALQAAIRLYMAESGQWRRLTNDFSATSLRAAGPFGQLAGGPLTLTLLGEIRREHMPATSIASLAMGRPFVSSTFDRTQDVRSGYVEVRAPLTPEASGFSPMRGLELQLALRRDEVRTSFPENTLPGAVSERKLAIRHTANVFTVGGRVRPTSWMMLRASMATGEAPPDLRHLQERAIPVLDRRLLDPKRGGRPILEEGPVVQIRNGSHKLGQEKGRTVSAGIVLNPGGLAGPRLSVDLSRVEIRDEIVPITQTLDLVIADESLYPEQVGREPLSAADAARGYTAGRITTLYTGYANAGETVAETVDVQFDWTAPPSAAGQARLYGAATWQPVLRSKLRRGAAWIERAGLRDAPLEWRGHAGVEWTRGPLTVDLNVQHLGGYDLLWSPASPVRIQSNLFQGRLRVPSQTYVDVVVRRRFELPASSPLRALEARFSVQNLLDRSPPIVADPIHLGYDYRGDPRRRRFELLLTASF